MKRILLFFAIASCLFVFLSQAAAAEEKAEPKKAAYGSELEELRQRIEDLEKRVKSTEAVDELGHKFHPIHSIYGLKIGGGLTVTAQGILHDKGNNQRGAGALSADIILESPVGKDGRAVAVFDFQRGAGLQNLPPFFTAPNGNATGPNNDIESFNNDQIHVAQFYYEHNLSATMVASIGQLDPTAYFDTNRFANNERIHFLANEFANNPAIEFGGTENFYTLGTRLTYQPVEAFDITVGAFEGNGDYADSFDKPFSMAELNFKLKPADKEGNYRIYYWNRQGRDSSVNTANPNDADLMKAKNSGVGFSIDQVVTDMFGVWLRAGAQREKVAQFDRHISGGLNITGASFGRPDDAIGLGYGMTLMGKTYKNYKEGASSGFKAGAEQYMELYYNIAVAEAPQMKGFHISPDIQYVINPGGDTNATKVFIYGIRLQTFF
ncbi:MAG: carbohydrate porin [Deltaproteobacteria bacterium]|nr:carbohydrate porin [Deltaproteobacteria bacterium]